ncbi:hypothetical protein WJX84_005921 [Apatococcus fuscideae]|uniref:glycerophosphodiester phosphodiesterase n=1 Tax=Apatococcus fuscideae TaxID=2026836 RepID=A0AAW1T685_9CHLO
MMFISLVLMARAWRLFVRLSILNTAGSVVFALCAWRFGLLKVIFMCTGSFMIWLFGMLLNQPDHNVGHRCGAMGFRGAHVENTVPALQNLIRRDNARPADNFSYIEFDIHETLDNKLVVLHDLDRVLRVSAAAPVNAAPLDALRQQGVALEGATVKDVTQAQLQSIHIAGREGLHVPTLGEFLRCCAQEGLRRSVAVEVKSLHSNAGRTELLTQLRLYKERYAAKLEDACPERKYPYFDWIAVISFPFFFAASFGEFGSECWRTWGLKFQLEGVNARSCVLHSLDLFAGVEP